MQTVRVQEEALHASLVQVEIREGAPPRVELYSFSSPNIHQGEELDETSLRAQSRWLSPSRFCPGRILLDLPMVMKPPLHSPFGEEHS